MGHSTNHITVYEHQTLRLGQHSDHGVFDVYKLRALQIFHGEGGVPYYSLIHNGVKFCEYVGVIQVGKFTIEVLPKADKSDDEAHWRSMLIDMLKVVGIFKIQAPSSSNLKLKPNSILDLYFELLIQEVEILLHHGLVKKYKRDDGNSKTLKGSIQFAKHIQTNVIHKERFYVSHSLYDVSHTIHKLIYKALQLLRDVNTNSLLSMRIASILLHFPQQEDIKVTQAVFDRLKLDRKTDGYRHAIVISQLLLMNYHPDVRSGNNNVLALMFDMNALWEQFVYTSIRKHKPVEMTVETQHSRSFWKPTGGAGVGMRPDIVVNKDKSSCAILDAKWKNLGQYNPSPDDLRQMFVYHEYFHASKVALVYPGDSRPRTGLFYETTGDIGKKECSILPMSLKRNVNEWQKSIYRDFEIWLNP